MGHESAAAGTNGVGGRLVLRTALTDLAKLKERLIQARGVFKKGRREGLGGSKSAKEVRTRRMRPLHQKS